MAVPYVCYRLERIVKLPILKYMYIIFCDVFVVMTIFNKRPLVKKTIMITCSKNMFN